jgi:hypothetical protein
MDEDEGGVDGTDRTRCLRCSGALSSLGVRELRAGGMTGAAHLLLGQWAEIGEEKLAVEILVCNACRRLEFVAAGGSDD